MSFCSWLARSGSAGVGATARERPPKPEAMDGMVAVLLRNLVSAQIEEYKLLSEVGDVASNVQGRKGLLGLVPV